MKKIYSILPSLFLLLGLTTQTFAYKLFPLLPQITFTSNFNQNSNIQSDALAPIFGDNTNFLFIGNENRYSEHEGWLTSYGVGLRKLYKKHIITGFIYADYNSSPFKNKFWTINPGFQWMTKAWDLTVNAYLPIKKYEKISKPYFGEQIGVTKYIEFANHTQYDALFYLVER